jgi:FdhD protein
MAGRVVAQRRIVKINGAASTSAVDHLAAEEPMEVRVDGQAVAVTMRTPGDDFDLALGFCLTEGLVDAADAVAAMRYCVDGDQHYNVVNVDRRHPAPVDDALRRNLYTTSSCGVCGTTSIDLVRRRTDSVAEDPMVVDAAVVADLPGRLREAQRVFDRTGGLHAAGLFTPQGELLCVREDVGRHNAVDKVIGWAAREARLPLAGHILVVSGRVAFEIVQKALMAGLPMIAAVSAPTSLAATLAEESGLTLIGFVRDQSMNIYTGAHRVVRT